MGPGPKEREKDMGRIPRIVVDGGHYHIIQRGNNKNTVFHKAEDYLYYISLFGKYLDKFEFSIFHYCLMPNHVHILLQVSRGDDLPKIMQGINLSYSIYHKRKYGYIGGLWQGRYSDRFIKHDEYFLVCGRYIERNPVVARIVDDAGDYIYSSYRYYALGHRCDFLTESVFYKNFGKDVGERRRRYREFVMGSMADSTNSVNSVIVGPGPEIGTGSQVFC